MDWEARLRRGGIVRDLGDFSLAYHVGVVPAVPPEFAVDHLVALTFRRRARPQGGHLFVTTIDLPAAVRLGARMGLDASEALAMVDSHERVHVAVQLEGATEEAEERQVMFVDAVWLSLRHEAIAKHLRAGDFGVVSRVGEGFWEALVVEDDGKKRGAD